MTSARAAWPDLPPLTRAMVAGAVVLGLVGAAVGLVLGLRAYPPTAWAATAEVGLPAAVLGAVLGLLVGSARLGLRRRLGRRS